MSNENETPRKRGVSAFQFIVLILIIVVIPPILQQADIDKEQLKIIGRACGAFAGVLTVWGLFSRLFRFAGIILAALVGVSVLVAEGVINPPKLMEKIEDHRDK